MLITANASKEDQLVIKAYHKAHDVHSKQVHAFNRVPFITHPLDVLNRISDWGVKSANIRQASILHESMHPLSENPATFSEISNEFNSSVANMVKECTFVYKKPKDIVDKKESKENHRQALRSFFKTFNEKSIGSLVIAVADRLQVVSDLIRSHPDKSKQAFDLGKDLFLAMKNRKFEIIEDLGEEVWARMRYQLDQTSQMTV